MKTGQTDTYQKGDDGTYRKVVDMAVDWIVREVARLRKQPRA